MKLIEKIGEDLKTAMREKNEVARDALRMLKAELTKAEIDGGGVLSDADQMAVLTRAVKTRTDSAKQYEEGGRPELAEKERAEILVVEAYLPKQLSAAEAEQAIQAIAAELGATEKKDMGRLMKAVTERYRGQVDGKTASSIAARLLS